MTPNTGSTTLAPMTPLQALSFARKHRVSPSGLHILLVLLEENPVNMKHIALTTGFSSSAATGVCDTLERDGWIERLRTSLDRRSWLVVPTEKTLTLFAEFLPPE